MKHTLSTLSMLAVAATMMGRPAAVAADLVCQERQLRAVVQLDQCWVRCERRVNVPTPRRYKPSDLVLADCRWTCWDRYDGALARIQRDPTCAPTPATASETDSAPSCTPDPDMCAARLSYAESGRMLCHSYCGVLAGASDGTDVESCTGACDDEYGKETVALMDDCLCQPVPQHSK